MRDFDPALCHVLVTYRLRVSYACGFDSLSAPVPLARSSWSSIISNRFFFNNKPSAQGKPTLYKSTAITAGPIKRSCSPPGLPHSSNTTSRYCFPSGGSVGAQLKMSSAERVTCRTIKRNHVMRYTIQCIYKGAQSYHDHSSRRTAHTYYWRPRTYTAGAWAPPRDCGPGPREHVGVSMAWRWVGAYLQVKEVAHDDEAADEGVGVRGQSFPASLDAAAP